MDLSPRLSGIYDESDSEASDLIQDSGFHDSLVTADSTQKKNCPDPVVIRKLKARSSLVEWSGIARKCAKHHEHYLFFQKDETTISVDSFVFIMAEEGSPHLGYLEDMYENKKGLKKVKLRWFQHNHEVNDLMAGLNAHPKEVFFTYQVEVISADCVDGLATVLTPKHYKKCVVIFPQISTLSFNMCFRQIKNNKVEPFNLTKLRGYMNQAIPTALDDSPSSKQKSKDHHLEEEVEKILKLNPVKNSAKKRRGRAEGQDKLEGSLISKTSCPRVQLLNEDPRILNFKVDDKVEVLSQDSGIQGCWFRCKVLEASRKCLKAQYDDLEDAEDTGNLEEWLPAPILANPDKLGMRCSSRLTICPWPPEDTANFTVKIGAAVDAWWCNGWWEGVVTTIVSSEDDSFVIYLPGENKFLPVRRKDVRVSRDWVGNRWVDIMPKPDILSCIPANAIHNLKDSTCLNIVGGESAIVMPMPEFFTTPKLGEDEQELADLAVIDDLEYEKQPHNKKGWVAGSEKELKMKDGIQSEET